MSNPPAVPAPRLESSGGASHAKVLLAEDNEVNQTVGRVMLESLGCEVDVARTGLEAIRALEGSSYDLVLMDWHMPEMDGLTASAEIRRRSATLGSPRIVALTADAFSGSREQCLAAGMDDYMSKPFRRDQLQAILQRWVPGKFPA
jgi:CheY-like chemotaxis protein